MVEDVNIERYNGGVRVSRVGLRGHLTKQAIKTRCDVNWAVPVCSPEALRRKEGREGSKRRDDGRMGGREEERKEGRK